MVFCCIRSLSCAIAWWSSILWSNVGLLTNRKKNYAHTHIARTPIWYVYVCHLHNKNPWMNTNWMLHEGDTQFHQSTAFFFWTRPKKKKTVWLSLDSFVLAVKTNVLLIQSFNEGMRIASHILCSLLRVASSHHCATTKCAESLYRNWKSASSSRWKYTFWILKKVKLASHIT